MLLAVSTEVYSFYLLGSGSALIAICSILAASQAVAIITFYMGLKDEPGSIRVFAVVPIMFLTALVIAMLATLG